MWLVSIIDAARDIYDFWSKKAIRFEKLQGYSSRYSFRLGGKYRLEVEIDWENEEKKRGIIHIETVSNHNSLIT
jgi:plasmid maintenance system killer protein